MRMKRVKNMTEKQLLALWNAWGSLRIYVNHISDDYTDRTRWLTPQGEVFSASGREAQGVIPLAADFSKLTEKQAQKRRAAQVKKMFKYDSKHELFIARIQTQHTHQRIWYAFNDEKRK